MSQRVVMGVTGASGMPYARRLLEGLIGAGAEVHLIISEHGQAVADAELKDGPLVPSAGGQDRVTRYRNDDLFSPLASGSCRTDGMIVCPCSCNTLSAVATGRGDSLIARAAHVHLKEGRRLVLCVREMPLTRIDLENMLAVSRAGATICPASPPFYGRPRTLDDLVNGVAGKLLDLLGIANNLAVRWPADDGGASSDPGGHG